MIVRLSFVGVWFFVFFGFIANVSVTAQAQPPLAVGEGNLSDFLRHVVTQDRYTDPILSPSGRYLMLVERPDTPNNKDHILVFDLNGGLGAPATRIRIGEFRVNWARWVSDDHIVTSISGIILFQDTGDRGMRLNYNLPRITRTISIARDSGDTIATLYHSQDRYWLGNRPQGRRGFDGAINTIIDWLPDDPEHVLMLGRSGRRTDIHKVNILTGADTVVEEGSRNTVGWFAVDGSAVLRIDITRRSLVYFSRTAESANWREIGRQSLRDVQDQQNDIEWLGQTEEAGIALVRARLADDDRFGIYRFDYARGEFLGAIAVLPDFDILGGVIDGAGKFAGYTYVDDTLIFVPSEERTRAHLEALRSVFNDDESVIPLTISSNRMVFQVTGPQTYGQLYVYDMERSQMDHLIDVDPYISQDLMRPMRVVNYLASDGQELTGYFSIPPPAASPNPPLIVYPHGGPESRDYLRFDPVVQYLTGLGYAVFQPNFRGSSGYGRAFADAGHGEWGRRMREDIDDGVRHLINEGEVNPDQICIVGMSYGGYAALAAAALSGDLYKCAVAAAPVTDLIAMLNETRRDNDQSYDYWVDQIGDPRRDRDRIEAVSPIEMADDMHIPIYLFHSHSDRIVPVSHSRDMAEALGAVGASFRYYEVSGGGHSWGQGRDFLNSMQNLRHFLADAMDGELDEFDPVSPRDAQDFSGPLRD
jgi:dipeptidyl aminopeptidase/acylaminoacyl peptidase